MTHPCCTAHASESLAHFGQDGSPFSPTNWPAKRGLLFSIEPIAPGAKAAAAASFSLYAFQRAVVLIERRLFAGRSIGRESVWSAERRNTRVRKPRSSLRFQIFLVQRRLGFAGSSGLTRSRDSSIMRFSVKKRHT